MTSGIEIRDGGLPRRPGARRQEHGGRKVIIAPDGSGIWTPTKTRLDETLIRALVRAHQWKRSLEERKYQSAGEMAEAEGVTRSFVNRPLRLTLLAPGIVETVLDGRKPKGMQLEELTRATPGDGGAMGIASPPPGDDLQSLGCTAARIGTFLRHVATVAAALVSRKG